MNKMLILATIVVMGLVALLVTETVKYDTIRIVDGEFNTLRTLKLSSAHTNFVMYIGKNTELFAQIKDDRVSK